MLFFNRDKAELEAEFRNPGIPETGLSIEELKNGLLRIAGQRKNAPHPLVKAELFSYLLDNMRIGVSPRDLFVTLGVWGHKLFDETILPVWEHELFSGALKKTAERSRILSDSTTVIFEFDFWHSVPDWDAILSLGFSGLLSRVEAAEKRFMECVGSNVSAENRNFFASVRLEYEAVQRLMNRICICAEQNGCNPETILALQHLRDGAPANLYECMLQIWLYYQLSEYADCIQTRSFGNLDRILYPYYVRDLESGKFTRDDIRTVFRNFMCRVSAMNYSYGHPFYFGGTNPDGSSAINELSHLILDEYGKLGIYDPKLQIKVAANTPRDFLDKALKLIRSGRNSIVFVGEPCIRNAMLAAGYSEEEARTADIKGCYEYAARGKAVETCPCILSLPDIVDKTMRTGDGFKSFDDFLQSCLRRLEKTCDECIEISNEFERYLDFLDPAPLFSGACASALEKGVDGYAKGSIYNNSNLWLMGPASAANALAMIRKYVYETQNISLDEFRKTLDADWKGRELLQLQIRNDPDKFGNGREMPDELMQQLVETAAARINGRRNSRGGHYTTALHAADYFLIWGQTSPATADGRRRGEEFSKNASVQPGSNRNGVTAMIRSVLKLNPAHFMADFPLDVMLAPSTVSGDDGLDAMRALMMTYLLHGGHAIHFNIFSTETLKDAQKHPERYADLQVRVCGWNVLWNNLTRREQDSYLIQAAANEERT